MNELQGKVGCGKEVNTCSGRASSELMSSGVSEENAISYYIVELFPPKYLRFTNFNL